MHSVHPNAPIMCKRADVIYRPGRSQIKASLRIFSKEKKDTSVSIGGVLFKVALNGVMVVRKMLFFGWPPINGAAINLSRGRFFSGELGSMCLLFLRRKSFFFCTENNRY